MFNPFAEVADSSPADAELVEQAKNGERAALEKLVLRHQAWIYNIAVRMVFRPQDAEEVTQEVLVKVITKLSTFKGESKFRTWLYRIAANHVLNMKRRWAETRTTTFADYGAAINGTPDLDLPDPKSVPVEVPLLVEEAKNGCTMGMLLCLDRKQRLIFTLGEILGASDAVGGEVLEMTADNFRQCLARARRDLHNFMNNQCGLVNKNNPCRCPKKTRGFIEQGTSIPSTCLFVPLHVRARPGCRADAVREIEDVVERQHVAIYRDHPFLQPADQSTGSGGSGERGRPRGPASDLKNSWRRVVTVGLPPCLRGRRSNHVETGKQNRPGDRCVQRHRGRDRQGAGGGRGRGRGELRDRPGRRGSCGQRDHQGQRSGRCGPGRRVEVGRCGSDVRRGQEGVRHARHPREQCRGLRDDAAGGDDRGGVPPGVQHERARPDAGDPGSPQALWAERRERDQHRLGGVPDAPADYSVYAASKAALDAVTGVLAKELAPRKIRVNSINPGATLSEGTRAAGLYGVGSEFEKQLVALTPLGRIGTPSDIAKVAVFLASDDSGWLTGEIILASGGLR